MGFNVGKLREEVRKEMAFYNKQNEKKNQILGIDLNDVTIRLRDGTRIDCTIEAIGRYEILIKKRNGDRMIIFKHSIDSIDLH